MRRPHLLFVLILALCAAVPARAQESLPAIVTEGLDAYRREGAGAALDAWLQGWPGDAQKDAKGRILEVMEEIVQLAGAPTGYDYLGSATLGPHVLRAYVVLLHERRPAFLRLDVYQADGGWRVLNVTVHTEFAEVFPPELLVPGS